MMEYKDKNLKLPKDGEIDVVYIWCDSSKKEYIENKNFFSQQYCLNKYWSSTRDHNEIVHSIQSVRKHMSWIRNIYVCSPRGHKIKDFDAGKYNVHYVSNEQILGEKKCPNFNSHSLELFTHKIPGLSDYFLQFNDDFFINTETTLNDFYNFQTKKIKYYYEDFLHLGVGSSPVTKKCIEEIVGDKYYFWAAHIPRMYYKNDIKDIIGSHTTIIEKTKTSKFRVKDDFQLTHFYGYYLLSKNKGDFIFINNTSSDNNIFYFIKVLIGKIFSENLLSIFHQTYIQFFFRKYLYNGKIFSNKNMYSLIHIGDDHNKNKKNILFALENRVKFICLNDAYKTRDSKEIGKILKENYKYFYKNIL